MLRCATEVSEADGTSSQHSQELGSGPRTIAKILSRFDLSFPSLSDAFRRRVDIGAYNRLQSRPTLTYFPFASLVIKERLNGWNGFGLVALVTISCNNIVKTG